MSIEIKVPEVGESITEVQIAEWLKDEGDAVQKDEPLVVIDSEKTTLELPAPESGTLGKILHQAGATVPVGEVIAHLEAGAGDAISTKAKSDEKPAAQAKSKPAASKAGAEKPSAPEIKESTQAETETVEAKAEKPEATEPEKEKAASTAGGVAEVKAGETKPGAKASAPKETSPQAREETSATATTDHDEEIVPMSMLRRTVARRLVEAKQQMAVLTTFNEADMSAVQGLRHEHQEAFEKRHEVKLGLMSFFVKAAVAALKQFPQLNAEVRGNDIVYHSTFNIGVAIATGRGLVVPVLRHAERLSFADVEKAIGDFVGRAKDGKLKPDELEWATFTITNGGVFGSLLSTPIINPPQSSILGLHTIQERPVAVQGQVVIRPMMYVALTYDHRIVDGREAVLFTRRIKEAVESPTRMLLEV